MVECWNGERRRAKKGKGGAKKEGRAEGHTWEREREEGERL